MSVSQESQKDLTSTIHLSQLRAVPNTSESSTWLDKLSPEERTIISQLSPDKAMLIGVVGPGKGFRFLLDSEVAAIGREEGSDISLDDVTVSRKHAVITASASKFIITDANSLNGTYVNAVSVKEKELSNGDEIQIGKFRFIFFTGKVNS